jgi:hypothetical protein
MTQTNHSSFPRPISLGKRVIIGAAIGLLVILSFVLRVREPHPDWGKFWMIRPLIVVPLAGAMGGLCNYIIVRFHSLVGINKIVAFVASAVIFIVGLWLGIVLGLVGTLWN